MHILYSAENLDSKPVQKDLMVWIDCEMTGLELDRDEICEVAVYITDYDLNIVDQNGLNIVVQPSPQAQKGMCDFVRNMHTSSGLLAELDNGLPLEEARTLVLDYVQKFIHTPKKAPLAGNSIGTDRMFLQKYMPDVEAHLHYRNIDVSSVKELAKKWYPSIYAGAPHKHGNHRAAGDILDSIAELYYYKTAMCTPVDQSSAHLANLAQAASLRYALARQSYKQR